MFERSATGDDVVPCPDCHRDGDLRVRFHTGPSGIGHERTDVFCAKCGKCFSAEQSRWAYADWNWWAITRWEAKGTPIAIAPLYSLLKEEADLQRNYESQQHALEEKLAASLNHFVHCPWKSGSRFQSNRWPTGIWETVNTETIYATNTGPMWLVHARKVRSSGLLDGESHTFSAMDADQMEPIAPFWRPGLWTQVVEGDDCLYNSAPGVITSIDRRKRRAEIRLHDGKIAEVRSLQLLKVPTSRFNQHAT